MLVHGTCIELDGVGILFRGPSGSGKSDLALRLIDSCGAQLVADDQVDLESHDQRLIARALERLAGLMEVRGVGIVPVDHAASARLALIADLCAPEEIERLPEPRREMLAGVELPALHLCAHEPSATAKVRAALALHRPQADRR
ncbi:MAG: HPr kinase/phosphatase C-terminal domain-containing protein [Rhodospirillales bacterium]|nr:HPr kinase/phosphatase C-terminal domain-containing protein [Rhodospirillales bacterium]